MNSTFHNLLLSGGNIVVEVSEKSKTDPRNKYPQKFLFPKEKKDSNLLLNGGDVVVDLPQGLLDLAVLPLKLHSHLADLGLHLVTHVCWEH